MALIEHLNEHLNKKLTISLLLPIWSFERIFLAV